MRDNSIRNRNGFSLIEMIISIAIVGIVMSGVVLLISYSTSNMRRTSNMVNLQNEAKDAMLHMSTHMQEATDTHWDKDKKALIVAKKIMNSDSTVHSVELSYYWVVPKDTTDVDTSLIFIKNVVDFDVNIKTNIYEVTGGSTSTPLASATPIPDPKYTLCFYTWQPTDPSSALTGTGEVKWDEVALDYEHFKAPTSSLPTLTTVSVATAAPTPTMGASPTTTPDIRKLGGKSAVVTLTLKNENGDAEFICEKEVFLRNQ